MEWDGISQIIKPGYVQSKLIGTSQSAALADPLWMNGVALGVPTDPALLLKVLNSMVRNRRTYARQRGWSLNLSDVALLMHSTVLEMLQQAQAAGGMAYWENYFGSAGQIIQTLDGYENRLQALRESKTLRLDGVDIPVLVEDNLGFYGSITIGGTPTEAYTGDIFFLVRRLNGMNVLENRFVDWNKVNYPFKNTDQFQQIQGGIARTGWVDEAKKCYYYFLEMHGRMVCMMMPMQGRISNITIVPNNSLDFVEQTAFWAPNTAAYGGARGGGGVPLLVGQRV
jgi:hypothetical protein